MSTVPSARAAMAVSLPDMNVKIKLSTRSSSVKAQ